MPTYEMPLLLRAMARPDIVTTLKRVSTAIFSRGGFIRKIDNLGLQPMPYKTSAHAHVHREANYFVIHFDAPPRSLVDLNEEYGRDIDIIRKRIYNKNEESTKPCTFHEEMLPPAYRPSVKKLMEMAQKQVKKTKRQFKYNSGLDYYPFQR